MWYDFFISKRKFTTVNETSTEWMASTRGSETLVAMIGLGQTSANRMRRSHDENGSIQMNMYSFLGDRMCLAFGRKACDENASRLISM